MDKVGGFDAFGDPVYRFNWGGVAVIRKNETDDRPTVKGGMSGTLVKRGRVSARYFFGRDRYPRWLVYKNDKGETVRVGREDEVPKGIIPTWEYDYIDFGRLHWFIERKLSPEQLVEVGLFSSANVPPRGEYVNLLEIQTPEGFYFEPCSAFLEFVMKHKDETENEKPSDLLLKDKQARQKFLEQDEYSQELRDNYEVDLYLSHTLGIPAGSLPKISRADINRITGAIPLHKMMGVI